MHTTECQNGQGLLTLQQMIDLENLLSQMAVVIEFLQDLDQAHRRYMFAIAGVHHLKTRLGDLDGKEINKLRK